MPNLLLPILHFNDCILHIANLYLNKHNVKRITVVMTVQHSRCLYYRYISGVRDCVETVLCIAN